MRRDFLELDASVGTTLHQKLDAHDHEAIRLMLTGGSVVDWHRVSFTSRDQVDQFLSLHLLDMANPTDRERLRYLFFEAVDYLEEHIKLHFPRDVRRPDDVRDIFLWASETGGFRRKQILSCVILKLMHVIHHMAVADLRHKTSVSEEEIFDMAQASILRGAREMRAEGLPVVSFYGSRKSRSSVITKLLAKKENVAATIFDKLRFRIVVPEHQDLLPVLGYFSRQIVPFNYVIPGQSHNNLIDPRDIFGSDEGYEVTGKNEFSGASYRMINFIVDYPVRLPDHLGPFGFELGRVVYVMVEFQLLDEATAQANEQGENAHHLYKERQHRVVASRLKRGRYKRRGQE